MFNILIWTIKKSIASRVTASLCLGILTYCIWLSNICQKGPLSAVAPGYSLLSSLETRSNLSSINSTLWVNLCLVILTALPRSLAKGRLFWSSQLYNSPFFYNLFCFFHFLIQWLLPSQEAVDNSNRKIVQTWVPLFDQDQEFAILLLFVVYWTQTTAHFYGACSFYMAHCVFVNSYSITFNMVTHLITSWSVPWLPHGIVCSLSHCHHRFPHCIWSPSVTHLRIWPMIISKAFCDYQGVLTDITALV